MTARGVRSQSLLRRRLVGDRVGFEGTLGFGVVFGLVVGFDSVNGVGGLGDGAAVVGLGVVVVVSLLGFVVAGFVVGASAGCGST